MYLERKRKPWIPEPQKNKSWNTTDFDYNSTRWKRDRALHLKYNPLCVDCKKEGRTVPATVSDHKTPISQGGDAWDWDNRQALCESCHNKKSVNERNKKYK